MIKILNFIKTNLLKISFIINIILLVSMLFSICFCSYYKNKVLKNEIIIDLTNIDMDNFLLEQEDYVNNIDL